MAITHFHGTDVTTSGNLPDVGEQIKRFSLAGSDLADLSEATFAGKRIVFNIFPSVGTDVCAASVRRFNELASGMDNTVVLCVSMDLPFALSRFGAAEGLDNVIPASAFRSTFGKDFGIVLEGSPLKGLFGRAVVVTDEQGVVHHQELVSEITEEPDYDAALAALR
ncbi:thiol peroxidase [Corynebacterium pseudotuberculosis]|uniref:thiol peroxidase n=1 Tax=Corynebacterium pseudotuberculosis TaxID=1719 RepID=UPI00059CA443|nr:thiol peroxidase [Corynebacterium pseudotuberculosis]AFM07506.2 thiol peroxidase [Corynebacterium pseudotuberculosis Cp162]APG81731.1 Thiol peroxidase [Corynebacterium pseudotuberculosis]WFP66335.1 thiol peroxidase [Corynebacterium pseudotuberculosis]